MQPGGFRDPLSRRDGQFPIVRRALFQFEHRGHNMFAVLTDRTGAIRRPLTFGEFEAHLIIFSAAHDRCVKIIRLDALQIQHFALGEIAAAPVNRFRRNRFEKPFDGLKQILP